MVSSISLSDCTDERFEMLLHVNCWSNRSADNLSYPIVLRDNTTLVKMSSSHC